MKKDFMKNYDKWEKLGFQAKVDALTECVAFYDEKADLLWTTFNDFNNLSPNEYYFHDKFTQELNSWDNEGIRKYIIWDKEDKLGEKMNSFAEEPYAYKLFYALRGKHLVGMILTSPRIPCGLTIFPISIMLSRQF